MSAYRYLEYTVTSCTHRVEPRQDHENQERPSDKKKQNKSNRHVASENEDLGKRSVGELPPHIKKTICYCLSENEAYLQNMERQTEQT